MLSFDRPHIMGVVNLTPDSFSDGGRFASTEAAVEAALRMAEEGADVLDVGGESTRPGAEAVAASTEIERIVPLIDALAGQVAVPISVDTSKPEVMRAAVAAGAGMINDVCALRRSGALAAAVELQVPVCLMHMQGEPRTMQQAPHYEDVVREVDDFLMARVFACEAAGLPRQKLLIDPGFGFGKLLAHNVELLRSLNYLCRHGVPVVAGLSRKGTIGVLSGVEQPEQRVAGSVAAAILAVQQGAAMVRVHDVAATRQALAVVCAVSTTGD